jgi:hypothetical protein
MPLQKPRYESNASDIFIAVFFAESQSPAKIRPHNITV